MRGACLLAVVLGMLALPLRAEVKLAGPLPPGNWRTLLHLGADFNTHHLRSTQDADRARDFLAAYGGETNQTPYPGLAYTLPQATTADNTLVWTALTNRAPDGLWSPREQDQYVKYWHLYLIVPGEADREVRFHFRHDDCIRMWNNGRVVISLDGWDQGHVRQQDGVLHAGVNAITIKLREGGGADYMAMRVTDRGNAEFDDLHYTLAPEPFFLSALPVVEVGETDVVLRGSIAVATDEPSTLQAVWAVGDRGEDRDAWQSHGGAASLGQPENGAFEFRVSGLEPDTLYHYRFVAATPTDQFWSEPVLRFRTKGAPPAVEAGEATRVRGVQAELTGVLAGGATATCSLHLGLVDGDWSRRFDFGSRFEGALATNVTGLTPATRYVYRLSASNAYGTVWSPAASAFTTAAVSAETLSWTGAGGADWGDPANWSPDLGVYPQAHDTAVVTHRASGTLALSLDGDQAVHALRLTGTAQSGGVSIGTEADSFAVGAGGMAIIGPPAGHRTVTFGSRVELAGDAFLNLDNGGTGLYRFDGPLSGTGGVTIAGRDGGAAVHITAAGSFSGPLRLHGGSGTLVLRQAGTLAGVARLAVARGAVLTVEGGEGRLRPDAVVSLRQGGLLLAGQEGLPMTESIDTLRIGDGYATITLRGGAQAAVTARVARIARDADSPAVLVVDSVDHTLGAGSHLVVHGADGGLTLVGGNGSRRTDQAVVPFALGRTMETDRRRPNTFLRHDREAGLLPLDPASEYVNAVAADYRAAAFPAVHTDGRDNVRLPHLPFSGQTAVHVLALPEGDTVVNALFVDGDASESTLGGDGVQIRIQGGDSLTVRSGAIAMSGTAAAVPRPRTELQVPTVLFGEGGEGVAGVISYFGHGSAGGWHIASRLVGTRGLTFCHVNPEHDSILSGDNSGLQGVLTITGGSGRGVSAMHHLALGDGRNALAIAHASRLVAQAPPVDERSLAVRSLAGHGTVRGVENLNVGGDGRGGAANAFTLLEGGLLSPGDRETPGHLTLDGFQAVAFEGGTLSIRLRRPVPASGGAGGPPAGSRVVISGATRTVTLSGSELIVAVDEPLSLGDTFRIVTIGGSAPLQGTFRNPGGQAVAEHAGQRYFLAIRYGTAPEDADRHMIALVVTRIEPVAIDTLLLLY